MLTLFGIREAVAAANPVNKQLQESVVLWQVAVYELDDLAAWWLQQYPWLFPLGIVCILHVQCGSLETRDIETISEDVYLCQEHLPVVVFLYSVLNTIWKGPSVGPSNEHIN
jgi:hypothetical protein